MKMDLFELAAVSRAGQKMPILEGFRLLAILL
jgi:hypothetical protein